ncbi:ATP-dependent nuclease [Maricaulis sp. CAU 1757]
MRECNIKRDWRSLGVPLDDRAPGVKAIRVSGVPGLDQFELALDTRLTILAGTNGAGKTSLLRAIWAGLAGENAVVDIFSGGTVEVDIRMGADLVSNRAVLSSGSVDSFEGEVANCIHIDGAASSRASREAFREFTSFDEITNGVASYKLSDPELSEVGYILGRHYDSVDLYEVEIEPGRFEPFFQAKYGEDLYDSRTMGAGELSALYIWWSLKEIPKSAIVLIEEPEVFLSHSSQQNLSDYLATRCKDRNWNMVICTHSGALIQRAPDSCIKVISRNSTGVEAFEQPFSPVLLEKFGVVSELKGIIVVEDDIAHQLCKKILYRFAPDIRKNIDITFGVRGESEIRKLMLLVENLNSRILFIGVLDGDIEVDETEGVLSLPGGSFERDIMGIAESRPEEFRQAIEIEDLTAVLSAMEGHDPHDWFNRLSLELNIDNASLVDKLFALWSDDADRSEECRLFVDALRDMISSEGGD